MPRAPHGDADFRIFSIIWNQTENRATPAIHYRMAQWLQHNWESKNTRLLLMAFRSSGKSTMTALFAAWLLYRDPDVRIMVLAADQSLAGKMVRQVKKIIERHPYTAHLKPDNPDQWAGNRFTVKRYTQLRDPSMLARGIGGNITGSRADIVICDDVEVPNTCDTAEKRRELRERLAEINYVLVPGGTQIYIGTPHSWYSLYSAEPRFEIGEDVPFLQDFTRLEMPLMNAAGESAWPERFSPYEIDKIRTQSGPNKFASQMMLRPVSVADGRLDPSLLHYYESELHFAKELNTLFLGDEKMTHAAAWWDPSFGSARGDNSVLAAVFCGESGRYFVHRVAYIKTSAHEQNAAAAQCRAVASLAKDLFLPSITVESNGIGAFLPGVLKAEIANARAACGVQHVHSTKPKDIRILESFDALLAARQIYVHRVVAQTPFIGEMREWRPGRSGARDDGLDAVAGAISLIPPPPSKLFTRARHNWMKPSQPQLAKTEFDV